MLDRLSYCTMEEAEKSGRWRCEDLIPLRDEARYVTAFARTPYRLAFDITAGSANIPDTTGKPGVITFLCSTNATGGEQIPLTPWILAHRMGHAIQAFDPSTSRKVADAAAMLLVALADPSHNMKLKGTSGSFASDFVLDEGLLIDHEVLLSEVMTTRAARRNALQNDLDVFAELVAQFFVQGGVTLQHPPSQISVEKITNHWMVKSSPVVIGFDHDPGAVQQAAACINELLNAMASELIGQTVSF